MGRVMETGSKGKEIFCGIDLHDRSLLAAIGVGKEAPWFREYRTDENGVMDLIRQLRVLQDGASGSRVYVAYEASGCGFGLLDRLRREGFLAEVLNPSGLATSRKHRSEKTDRNDARLVLEALRSSVLAGSRLPTVWIPPQALRDDREVVRRRLQLAEDVSQSKQRLHGFLKRNGHRRPAELKSLWTKKFVLWLEWLADQVPAGQSVELRSLLRELAVRRQELELLNEELERLSRRSDYRVRASALKDLPGVGLLTAMVFLTELGDLHRFRNRRSLANYLGLTPRSHESGEQQDRKGHISKMGPARVRKVLNQAAWALIRVDADWRKWYLGNGRSPKHERKRRITAVMRRLGIWMWHTALEAAPEAMAAAA